MYEPLEGFLSYVTSMSLYGFLAVYWYFLAIEFTRYVLFDFLILFDRYLHADQDQRLREEAKKSLYKELPLISVIAPGKNEGKHIPKLSKSLKRQSYKNIEIIIVDDGSDDNTAHICKRLLDEKKIDIFISNPDRGGKASAANIAFHYTQGKYVVHLDADSYIDDNSIENLLLNFYMDPNCGAVAGDVRVNNTQDSIATTLQAIEYLKTISLSRLVSSRLNILRIISGAYGAFRRDILEELKGWDVGPGLDGDITVKIRKMGYRVVFDHNAICYTNAPNTFKKIAKQRFRWDRSLVRFRLRKHKDIYKKQANSSFLNFVTIADGVLYNFVFNLLWWVYMVQLIYIMPDNLGYILLFNYLLYFGSNILQYIVIVSILGKTMRSKDKLLLLYLPLMPLYSGVFLRLIRTYAQLMELFFKISYYDPWNPWKVSKQVKDKGM